MGNLSTTILSNVDPFSFPLHSKESTVNLQEAQWHALFGKFGIVYFHAQSQKSSTPQDKAHSQKSGDTLEDLVDEECRWTPALRNLGLTYTTFVRDEGTSIETPSETTVSRAILQLARAYYEDIWQSLTTDEQLALFHISKPVYSRRTSGLRTLTPKRSDPF